MGEFRLRETIINASELVGKEIYYKNSEVGHIIGIDGEHVRCAVNSDIVAQMIKGNRVTFSMEVIDR